MRVSQYHFIILLRSNRAITEAIPAFINQIIQIRGNVKQQWIAHSWGGVLLSSYLAHFAESNGNLHNYGHIDILDAINDHFPKVLAWLQQFH